MPYTEGAGSGWLRSVIMILGQVTTTTTIPLVETVDPARPLTAFIVDFLGLEEGSLTAGILGAIIEPALQVLLIAALAWIVIRLLRRVGRRVLNRLKDDPSTGGPRKTQRLETLGSVLSSVLGFVVWTVAVVTILGSAFGINIGPFLAGAGILGIALGFGAQDLVKDMLSGLFMMAEDQYGVGDVVDVGDASGEVERLGVRSTRIRDVTGTLWHIPNGEIRRVGNMSQEWSRSLLDITVGYDADVDETAELIKGVADAMATEDTYHTLFLADPEIWGVEALTSDAIVIRLVIKTLPGEQWAISRELRRRIKLAFDAAGVPTPIAQRTVWMRRPGEPSTELVRRDLAAPTAATGKGAAEEGAEAKADGQTEPVTED